VTCVEDGLCWVAALNMALTYLRTRHLVWKLRKCGLGRLWFLMPCEKPGLSGLEFST
jgi:hypothetical protein